LKGILAIFFTLFSSLCIAKPLTEKDYALLALTIYHEARGEPSHGQQAILEVVLNRVTDKKSVKDVILAPYQFSFTMMLGWFAIPHNDMRECIFLVKKYEKNIKSGKRVLPKGTKYFHTHSTKPKWVDKMIRVASIGGHKFYKQTKENM